MADERRICGAERHISRRSEHNRALIRLGDDSKAPYTEQRLRRCYPQVPQGPVLRFPQYPQIARRFRRGQTHCPQWRVRRVARPPKWCRTLGAKTH